MVNKMKTVKEFEEGCKEVESLGRSPCSKNNLCDECEIKLQTLKDVLELIDERIERAKETLKEKVTDNMRSFLDGLIKNLEKLKKEISGE